MVWITSLRDYALPDRLKNINYLVVIWELEDEFDTLSESATINIPNASERIYAIFWLGIVINIF